ncbi:MAG: peptidyl-tRNA hydrolase Pth2 [Thermoplasmata archaeon]
MDFEYKLVIVVRKDLKLSAGKMAAQVAHAAVSCALSAKAKKPRLFKEWLSEGQRKIVVKAEDLKELLAIEKKASSQGLIAERIVDAGLTEVPPGTVTCVGIGPAKADEVDEVTGHLKLA